MGAVDTNVLVRLLTGDDARQTAAADRFIERTAWVPLLALVETTWVLRRIYKFGPRKVAAAVEMLLKHTHLVLQDADVVAMALELFRSRPALGFSDCMMLHVARKAGHLPLGTFDSALGKIEGAEKLGR